MARFKMDEADNYGGGSTFFSLKNDKDTAVVRFMYNTSADLEGIACHKVNVDGKDKYVECLRSYNEPVDNCPFCQAKLRVIAKYFVAVFDENEETVKVWERGRDFGKKISGLFARYNPLVSTPIEIERNGKPGDTGTDYSFFPQVTDNVTLEDLPEVTDIVGSSVLSKTADEMYEYLDTGAFPASGQASSQQGQSRRSVPASGAERPVARTRRGL